MFFSYANGTSGFALDTIVGWQMNGDGDYSLITNYSVKHTLTAAEFGRFLNVTHPVDLSGKDYCRC